MKIQEIYNYISSDFNNIKFDENEKYIIIPIENFLMVAKNLKNDKKLNFDFLMCITAIDNGDGKNFTVCYNFHSYMYNLDLELRVIVDAEQEIPSLVSIWKSADWHEREAYDLMGIKFSDHPDLKRILLPEDWEGHPLRKNYECADYYRGVPVPKEKSYWE